MYCLHCGDCCKRMSPISNPLPCPYLIEIQELFFCSIYDRRPEQCKNHDYPASKCPQGLMTLHLETPQDAHMRINRGYAIIKNGLKPVTK